MIGNITVKRYDVKELVIKYKNGKSKIIPAKYSCYYYWNGKKIAEYLSDTDTIYLNSNFLDRDHRATYSDRMKNSKHFEMWADLMEFLSINNDTLLSEYCGL